MLKFDNEMWGFLDFASRKSIIAQILSDSNKRTVSQEEGNFIKIVPGKHDMVSYLPLSKFEKVDNPWEQGRTSIKIGRFVRKFLNTYALEYFGIEDSKIEEFVNIFKSYFSCDESKLKIVEGKDILEYYNQKSYRNKDGFCGSLWNSCMRQQDRNHFMKLYSDNSNIKMLVYFDDDGKVRSRALLWEDVKDHNNPDKKIKFMDRIYSVFDHDVIFFKSWAKKNGYICKAEQSAKSQNFFEDINGNEVFMNLYVILDAAEQEYYPYLDTFKFYNRSLSRFSNSEIYSFDYILIQSNGDLERREDEFEEESDEDE
jgi:hypothetical protein